jgi:CDP-diacylglycerol---serine O-phosphatidyltransferase
VKGGCMTLILRLLKWVPNLFTIGNLLSGVFSIAVNMNSYERLAALFIFLAAFFDLFDGKIARKLKVNSEFGVELDSLADIISFGVAPAMLFHTLSPHSWLTVLAFMIYPSLGALRLAKFSANPTVGYFIGLPIPFPALIIALLGMFYYVNPYLMIILAILMVSPIRVMKI